MVSNPLYRCVEAEAHGSTIQVVERNVITGRYRARSVDRDK